MKSSKTLGFSLAFVACVLTLWLSSGITTVELGEIYSLVLSNYTTQTLADNSVASIYLNYRIFDTIFEALMLLVSVMGVIHFSRHEHNLNVAEHSSEDRVAGAKIIIFVIPVIFLLGAYIIVNGHNTPGGGFQGGAALATAFICIYLVRPEKSIRFSAFNKIEKLIFLLIAIISVCFAVSNLYLTYTEWNVAYLVVMNILIGLKVFCGLTILFYRFVHYEDL